MELLHFDSDYMQLAHPRILERMNQTAAEYHSGYGTDSVCRSAKQKIREACGLPEAEVHFLIGGTQTNVIAIDAILKPYEGVLAAGTSHIGVHEAGAVEATGHKVLTLPEKNGKLRADDIDQYVSAFYADANWEHMVAPGMVYITHPTEYGTLYTLEELTAISATCHKNGLPLYLDGARLGYGLAATSTDVKLTDIARLTDAFYIGGTKCGAMIGEAIVFPRKGLVERFFTQIKRHCSLLAKGWIIGMQFDVLFTDGLYLEAARHADVMAEKLKQGMKEKGYRLYVDSPTNQQFFVVTPEQADHIARHTTFDAWENLPDGRRVIRLATSWYTKEEEVNRLLGAL